VKKKAEETVMLMLNRRRASEGAREGEHKTGKRNDAIHLRRLVEALGYT